MQHIKRSARGLCARVYKAMSSAQHDDPRATAPVAKVWMADGDWMEAEVEAKVKADFRGSHLAPARSRSHSVPPTSAPGLSSVLGPLPRIIPTRAKSAAWSLPDAFSPNGAWQAQHFEWRLSSKRKLKRTIHTATMVTAKLSPPRRRKNIAVLDAVVTMKGALWKKERQMAFPGPLHPRRSHRPPIAAPSPVHCDDLAGCPIYIILLLSTTTSSTAAGVTVFPSHCTALDEVARRLN